ncbi:MAG TPA: hypothetical protein VLI72_06825 [Methylibium sp.]|nr:hypothetical protein [Methylibium sp.]
MGLLLAAAGATGWLLRGPASPDAAPVAARPAAAPARAATVADMQPLVAVSSDGQVTLRVEQQPLDWVLDEIARQSGLVDLRRRGAEVGAGAAVACATDVDRLRTADPLRVLQEIERGGEGDRFQGLLTARDESVALAPSLLRTIYETDASERVRLLAFDAWLEQHADRPGMLREALDAALLLPGAGIQREARRRLDELDVLEHVEPADPQLPAAP